MLNIRHLADLPVKLVLQQIDLRLQQSILMLELPLQVLELDVLVLRHFYSFVGLSSVVNAAWSEAVLSQLGEVKKIQLRFRVPWEV